MQNVFSLILLLTVHSVHAQGTVLTDTLKAKTVSSVTVMASQSYVKVLVDKTVLNIAAKPSLVGQNALDVLKTAPGVVVDPNENIQMGGKNGVTVFIDGQNTQLSSQDLAQLLKSIESDNIKEIEIISNPSAKYEAAGNAGIINIVLKKSITNGWNGSLTANSTQSTHGRYSLSTNQNVRKNKWNWFGNLSMNKGYQETIANNDRKLPVQEMQQRGIEKDDFGGNSSRAGVDYALNKKTTIGMLWIQNNRFTNMDNNNLTLIQSNLGIDTNVFTQSVAPSEIKRNNLNLNYKWINGAHNSLNVDADITRFHSSLDNLVNSYLTSNIPLPLFNNAIRNKANVQIEIKGIKADYAYMIAKRIKAEAGLKTVYTVSDNQLGVYQQMNTIWKADTGKSNDFQLKERIHAGYMSFQANHHNWTFQTGLRAEYTSVNGRATSLDQIKRINPDTSYINLFPTVFIQYQLNAKNQLGLSVSKRIDRPSYQDQNPFVYQLDAFNSEQGNPYLLPQITYSAELSYTYQYATSFKLQYSITRNYIEQLTYQVGKNTIMTPQNAGERKILYFSMSSPVRVNSWWNIYISISPFYQNYQVTLNGFGTVENRKQSSWGVNGYMSQNFQVGKGWNAEITGWYNFQNATTIYQSKPLGSINLGLSKKIFQEKATIKLALTDLFNTQRWEQTARTNALDLLTYRKWESRNISLGFSFRFGNNKIKTARERETGANTEIDRIKQ